MYKFTILLSALLLTVVYAAPTFATPLLDPGGDDTGFVAPSQANLKCERYLNKRVLLASTCTMQCHFKQVGMIFKNLPFDEDACEDGAIKTSCKSKYDKALTAISSSGICPPCLDAPSQQVLYTTYRDIAESLNPMVYCDSTTANVPFGGDDSGFSPLQVDVKKCEDKFGKNVMKLLKCVSKCHRYLADNAFTGAPFNEEDCEETDPVDSCKARFEKANSLLHGCPACIDQQAVFTAVTQAFDSHNGDIYCGGAEPTPTPTTTPTPTETATPTPTATP